VAGAETSISRCEKKFTGVLLPVILYTGNTGWLESDITSDIPKKAEQLLH